MADAPAITTYPEMNARLVGILRTSDQLPALYAAQRIEELQEQVTALTADVERLTTLLREAYPYLPYTVSLAEELAAMFPDIARPQDL